MESGLLPFRFSQSTLEFLFLTEFYLTLTMDLVFEASTIFFSVAMIFALLFAINLLAMQVFN